MLSFYGHCICEASSQHHSSFRGYKTVLLYYLLLYCTYTVMCYCVSRFFVVVALVGPYQSSLYIMKRYYW